MSSYVFWKQCPKESNLKPLYTSQAILQNKENVYNVIITEEFVQFDDMCIMYDFELKFGIKENGIYFEYQNQLMNFLLPLSDAKKWRDCLKFYLNQRGFHETFRAIKKIGKGNFASVYLVERLQNKEKLAVKAFSKEAAYSQENGKQCLIKEIDIMRHLRHPSLMRLEEVFESDNSLYIVFELLQGGQLYDQVKNKCKFSPAQTQRMMRALLEGLHQMHSYGIMHRDLKPENILIRSHGTLDLVIADFGLSEFVSSKNYLFVRCGTPGYVAPEVINIKDMKKRYTEICDIFSAGIIFHIFLFGYSVFRSKTYNQVLAENRACSYNFQAPEYQCISTQCLDLLQKMLRVNPEQRITSQEALNHPYFKHKQAQETIEQLSQQEKLSEVNTQVQKTELENDSCLKFQLGRQNIVVGKTQTVAQTGKTNCSVFGKALGQGRLSKISKFSSKPNS